MKLDAVKAFESFVSKEIEPATKDLKKLDDASRKHVQRLVYTNLVDRFDSMIDHSLLDNCREDALVETATKKLNQPMTEADLLQLLLKGDQLQDALEEQLRSALRDSALRERHSRKLNRLLAMAAPDDECWSSPRVQVSSGKISGKVKVQGKSTPHSICGFADWLYSRRNIVVHGAGSTSFLANDREQLKKLFKVEPAQRIRLQLSSVFTAITFYRGVAELISR
jgi:hypothetical protein